MPERREDAHDAHGLTVTSSGGHIWVRTQYDRKFLVIFPWIIESRFSSIAAKAQIHSNGGAGRDGGRISAAGFVIVSNRSNK